MKLLIIEDELDLREILVASLRQEGHTVEAEGSGKDGLLRALHQDYDLVILDIMLPDIDGWEILSRLREKKTTPVLMLTSLDAPADKVKGLDLGSDDYMPKPFDLDELKARIRAILRRGPSHQSSQIEISSDTQFDPVARHVLKDGLRIEMTAKEINLLEVFLQRRGRILSKDQITELIFEDVSEGDSNVVEVYIYNLRKKLGRGIIKTRRGMGYELIEHS